MKLLHNRKSRRRRGRKRDAAHDKRQINRHSLNGKNDSERQRNDEERSQRLRKSRDEQRLSICFEPSDDQLRPQHQSECALHPGYDRLITPRIQKLLRQQSQGMRTEQHAGNQPAQNRRQLQILNEPAADKCNHQNQNPSQKQYRHKVKTSRDQSAPFSSSAMPKSMK